MDNQHRKIKGYRELSQQEIDLMNEIKEKGEELHALCDKLELQHRDNETHIDTRWLDEGKMSLQQGIMFLVRSVAQPSTF